MKMKILTKLAKLEILAGAVFSFVNLGQMIYYNCKVPPRQEIIERLGKGTRIGGGIDT